jgi:hypothetical protein
VSLLEVKMSNILIEKEAKCSDSDDSGESREEHEPNQSSVNSFINDEEERSEEEGEEVERKFELNYRRNKIHQFIRVVLINECIILFAF